MDSYQFDDRILEDQIFGGEEAFNPAFSNEAFIETPAASDQKGAKSRRTGGRSQAAKPAAHPAKQGAQPLVQWQYVSPRQLQPRLDQPRQTFDPVALAELAASVQSRGVLQPILVRAVDTPSSAETVYEILAGERRWRASQAAGLTQVPILVQHLDDAAAREVALIENVQREDLTPLETASALTQMMQQGYSIRKLANKLGKKKGWLEQHLMLTRLPADLLNMVSGRPDTATHARDLEKVNDPLLRAKLIALVQDEGLPLAELRRYIRQGGGIVPKAQASKKSKKQAESVLEVPTSENTVEAIAVAADATEAVAVADEGQATLLEQETLGTECFEADGGTTTEASLRQSAVTANLRALIRALGKLDRPADSAVLAEMTQLLRDAQAATVTTLERWSA